MNYESVISKTFPFFSLTISKVKFNKLSWYWWLWLTWVKNSKAGMRISEAQSIYLKQKESMGTGSLQVMNRMRCMTLYPSDVLNFILHSFHSYWAQSNCMEIITLWIHLNPWSSQIELAFWIDTVLST